MAMNKDLQTQVLFYTRLLLYILAFSIPFFHPAIVVSYDAIGFWFWFIILPAEMFIAFYISPPVLKLPIWLLTAVLFPLITMFFVMGFSPDLFVFTAGGAASFVMTVLIFKTRGRGKNIAILEVFLLGIIYFKLLSFSRASEEVAQKSYEITKMLLTVSIAAFLLHSVILYLSFFKQKKVKKERKELIVFLSIVIPLLLMVALVLPSDFIDHVIELNIIKDDVKPEGIEIENLDGMNSFNNEGNSEGDENYEKMGRLEGLDADQWSMQLGEDGSGKQYAVMIVVSKRNTIYAAKDYFGIFDPEKGFIFSNENPLNELSSLRIIETWKNNSYKNTMQRSMETVFFLSRFSYRFLPYEPLSFEPTILNYRYYPFSYSYNTVSDISYFNYTAWEKENGLYTSETGREFNIRELSNVELQKLSDYLSVPLENGLVEGFRSYTDQNVNMEEPYMDRLLSILQGFSTYQYKLGYTEDVSVKRMEYFINEEKEGDCTEFSNSTAILARLAGIPSRVVTGYLASKYLQTPMHKKGLMVLMQSIELLSEFPLEDLILVTTAHRHSWTQVYIPDIGWIDIEPTSYAIPPPMNMNFNNADLVIPIISDKERTIRPGFEFPWLTALFIFLFFSVGIVISIYLYRYIKEAVLFLRFKNKNDIKALKAIYQLLLMKLAESGYSIKPSSKTIIEYSEVYTELKGFAEIYTKLRYNENLEDDETDLLWNKLCKEYESILITSRKHGFLESIKRCFSLKGLMY